MRTALLLAALTAAGSVAAAQTPDWAKTNPETMRHFEALIRIDTSDPPGNETRVVDYIRKVFDAEGIPYIIAAQDPARANIIARLKGNGSKRPLLIVGHSDVVKVDPSKWTYPPFGAEHHDGYVYGRGTRDDKSDLIATLMTMVLLKRSKVPLDRDVIFLSEAGEEATTGPGIEYIVNEHWKDIDAEICLAEAGGVFRKAGKPFYAFLETTEKQPMPMKLTVKGTAGHGSIPLRNNAVAHLSRAVGNIAAWDPPMRFNDTTRTYFEKLGNLSTPEDAARYKALFDPAQAAAAREYFAEHDPLVYSLLHTSISPNMFSAGFQVNVIPSSAEATLDIRAFPGENMPAFYDMMRKVINDPAVELTPIVVNNRPPAAPSRIDTDAYHSLENAMKKVYGVEVLPFMQTGATDMAFLRAKGMQCYGVGPMYDVEDGAKGFGPHSDQERVLEESIHKHVQFFWQAVTDIAGTK